MGLLRVRFGIRSAYDSASNPEAQEGWDAKPRYIVGFASHVRRLGLRGGQREHAGLEVQQQPFALKPAAVPGQAAVGTDHTVARHDHGDRIAAVGQADGTSGAGRADLTGDLPVADGLAVWDLAQRLPHAQLERVALQA